MRSRLVVWVSLEFVAILLKKRMLPGKGWVGAHPHRSGGRRWDGGLMDRKPGKG